MASFHLGSSRVLFTNKFDQRGIKVVGSLCRMVCFVEGEEGIEDEHSYILEVIGLEYGWVIMEKG